ncbi:MAG: hypothetical protein AAF845_00455 [Bacteroidota bacterium]
MSAPADAQERRAAGVAAMQPASPSTYSLRHTSVSTLAISGDAAERRQSLRAPNGAWVYGISLGERADNPCYLSLWWATAEDGRVDLGLSEFQACNRGGPTNHSLSSIGMRTVPSWDALVSEYHVDVDDPSPTIDAYNTYMNVIHVLSHPSEAYQNLAAMFNGGTPRYPILHRGGELTAIKSLSVCQKESNQEMKGLTARGVTLTLTPSDSRGRTRPIQDGNGEWINNGVYRPHCDHRRAFRACPNGQVVIGVDIHYDDGRNAKIKGVAPICGFLSIES